MRIGVIGAGRLGGTLATWCAESGHEVAVTSRHPDRLQDLADRSGAQLRVMSVPQAAAFGDLLVFAPNWCSAREAVEVTRAELAGKVVIDTTNPDDRSGDGDAYHGTGAFSGGAGHDSGGKSGLETLIEWAPEAHWVKAFNTIPADVLSRRRGHDPLLAEFVCTDETDARTLASQIIRDLGFAPFYAGGAHAAWLTEPGGPLQKIEVDVADATDVLAEALATLH
ncbi:MULTISPECIES: NAD(P)-binding domain-containing protein [Actinoplanes]|uniref:NADPH-dependent F420 reductase n=1 Tax=Actinoplanes TaxID=1865 RepID=UPI0005F2A581|nr:MULTISPECIES: NAD(P)-binding domain-containing protein [Actinoplanes]GLX99920.1 hypothetical protein Acsp01_03000 [Actinoplanes sp. NBRC 101535]